MFDGEQLMWILRKLTELKDFLDMNATIFMPASAGLMSNRCFAFSFGLMTVSNFFSLLINNYQLVETIRLFAI